MGNVGLKHVVVTGSGRSGTNRLLDILDMHGLTLCRSEVHALDGDFGKLSVAASQDALPADFSDQWSAAVASSIGKMSRRDRMKVDGKSYLNLAARVVVPVLRKTRLRKVVLAGDPDEWPIPRICMRPNVTIVPVLKIQSRQCWLLRSHPVLSSQIVIHTLRNPADYLNSWWKRWVSKIGPEEAYRRVCALTAPIYEENDRPALPAEYSIENLVRGQLSIWRRSNGLISQLSGSPRYGLFRYEDVSSDPTGEAARLYDLAGLEFDDETRQNVATMRNTLFKKIDTPSLDRDMIRSAMEDVLSDCPLGSIYLP